MAERSGFDVPRFCARYLAEDHNGLLGLHYRGHSPGHLELELPYNPAFARDGGTGGMADGTIVTLLDMAGTISVWSRIDRFRPHATIDLRIDHLRIPPAGPVTCAVDCFHVDAELARVRGGAFVDGEPVAAFTATYAFTDART
jgi:acyl-coenzyme A thioesterase PaaI-like protein